MKLILFIMSLFFADNDLSHGIAGKTYMAEIHTTCKIINDGGCMIYTYCVLKFEDGKVTVSHPVKTVCTPKEREATYAHLDNNESKQYNWFVNGKQEITIEGFNDYGHLMLKDNKLIGSIEKNGKPTSIEFLQQSAIKKQ